MPSDLLTLDTIFNNRIFRIPDYQRGYAWGKKQLNDFWEDLDRLGEGQKHYTGQITVEPANNEQWKNWDEETWLIDGRNFAPFYVVDGQQRLTTAIILLKCLLDATSEDEMLAYTNRSDHLKKFILQSSGVSKAYLFGYERDNPSYKCLKTEILGQQDGAPSESETLYTANLRSARDFFAAKLAEAKIEDYDRWFRALTQRFVFSWYELQEDLDAFVVFETMNYRGKPLSKLELLKNRLIYLTTVLPHPATPEDRSSLRRDINHAWSTIYSYLGKHHSLVLDDDEFLRAHWIMYFGFIRNKAPRFAEELLDVHFTLRRTIAGDLTAQEIDDYVRSIRLSAEAWFAIHHPTHPKEHTLERELRDWLVRIKRHGHGAFSPLLMACLLKNKNSQATMVVKAAERFNFLVSTLCKRRSNTGDNEFYRLANDVLKNRVSLLQTVASIDRKTKQFFALERVMFLTEDESEGFYSWSGRYYFLYEYEQELRRSLGMDSEKLIWKDFKSPRGDPRGDYHTIEHIFPRNAKTEEWPRFSNLTEGERLKYLHSLGNLLPLSKRRNSSFSNRPFSVKRLSTDNRAGYDSGSYSEIRVSKNTDWTPTLIHERGIELLEFLEKRWRISLGKQIFKDEILGIGVLS